MTKGILSWENAFCKIDYNPMATTNCKEFYCSSTYFAKDSTTTSVRITMPTITSTMTKITAGIISLAGFPKLFSFIYALII